MPPTDPTPTPTPREVLAKALANAFNLGAFYRETGGTGVSAPNYDVDPGEVDRTLAALAATGDAPLSAEEISNLYTASWFIEPGDAGNAFRHVLTAYTTLAAQLAAVRAERDALRGTVREFAEAMEAKLKANDRKGGWERMTPSWLRRRLDTELREFDRARKAGRPATEVLAEAADAANFLMMLADNYRRKHPALATPARPTDTGREG